jgi:hypothetical protein
MRRALVVFSGRADLPWQRLLKTGFRHCSLIVEDGPNWLLVEPLASCLQVRSIGSVQVDLAGRLQRAGFAVLETAVAPVGNRAAPLGLWTCVETVKRGLGVRSVWVQTPWQLFRHLEQNRKIGIDIGIK